MAIPLELRFEMDDLFRRYGMLLDKGELDEWLDLFAEECTYRLMPRENHDRDLPLAIIRCESRGMLRDRVYAVQETMMYEPHYVRHVIGSVGIEAETDRGWSVEASYAVFETRPDQMSRVLNVGRYVDEVVREGGALKFAHKLCVFDSLLVPNSIVMPI